MGKQISISPGAWKIMRHLWDEAPLTITQLVGALKQESGWSKPTVISTLNRLEEKGAVRWEQEPGERARRYYANIDEKEAAARETGDFLDRVYQGRFGLMASAMAEARALTKDDIAELEQLLARIK